MKKATIFLSICISLNTSQLVYATQSLTWQKVSLEDRIREKLTSNLLTVLKSNQFLIEPNVEYKDPGQPNLGDNKAKGARVSDIKFDDSKGDYIAFSKVGLEVPVLDSFYEEDKTKLTNLYRFNETYDIFKHLSKITVNVNLNSKLPEELQTIAKNIVNSTNLSFTKIKPEIIFNTMDLEWIPPVKIEEKKDIPEKEPTIWAKDWFEWASRWGNAFGLILATLIISYVLLRLFRQVKQLLEDLQNKKEVKNEQEDQTPPESTPVPEELVEELLEDDVEVANGITRFQQCLKDYPEIAIQIVSEWIADQDERSAKALIAISQQLSQEDADFIIKRLNETQKKKWSSSLGDQLSKDEIKSINKYIFQEVVRVLLVPSKITDRDLQNMIMCLSPKMAIDFLAQQPEFISILFNVLNQKTIARMMKSLDPKTLKEWLLKVSDLSPEQMEIASGGLKACLFDYLATQDSSITMTIANLLSECDFESENSLYEALAKKSLIKTEEIAIQRIPYDIIFDLPLHILKESFLRLNNDQRIETLVSLEQTQREALIDAIAAPQSAAREVIDMDLQEVSNNSHRLETINGRKNEIIQNYTDTIRKVVVQNSAYQAIGADLVSHWIKRFAKLNSIKGGKAA
jgi:hypothetical protein